MLEGRCEKTERMPSTFNHQIKLGKSGLIAHPPGEENRDMSCVSTVEHYSEYDLMFQWMRPYSYRDHRFGDQTLSPENFVLINFSVVMVRNSFPSI